MARAANRSRRVCISVRAWRSIRTEWRVFDFLPDKLLGKVENRLDFLGMLVFDKWVGNADSRQAVFFRARAKTWTPLKGDPRRSIGFFAQMIDHGFAFNGPHWRFSDSPLQGLYFRTAVYDEVARSIRFNRGSTWWAISRFEVIDSAWKEIPREWLGMTMRKNWRNCWRALLKRRSAGSGTYP